MLFRIVGVFVCGWLLQDACQATEANTKQAQLTPINWSPTIPIPLQTKGLCVFTDRGWVFVVHDKAVATPAFDLVNFWASHTVIEHEQAVIHVLKPAMRFSLRITPYLDLAMNPVLTGEQSVQHLQPISMQRTDNNLIFNGLRQHKTIEFVHEGRRFIVVLTSQVDDGYPHQLEMRPFYRVIPSLQGLAIQVDADVVKAKVSPNSLTLTAPMPGYKTTQHVFWSQAHWYGKQDQGQPTLEPAISFCQAMQALYQGDGARIIGTLHYLREIFPLTEYHPLARTLMAWGEYLLGRSGQTPHLLNLDDAPNWPGFYGDSIFCHVGFWKNMRWEILPSGVLKRIWEDAAKEAHEQQDLPSLRTLLNPTVAKHCVPIHRDFYQTVVARYDEPHLYPDLLKAFLATELRAPSCPPEMSMWVRYHHVKYFKKDTVALWSPFVPLWQLHQDMEEAFKAKKYREVLTAVATTPFNPVLSDVFQNTLAQKDISPLEKLGLYERFKKFLPVSSCNSIVANVIDIWCQLDLVHQASALLVSNQSVLSEDMRDRLWLMLAEAHASKKSWSDVEHSLQQISDKAPEEMRVPTQVQRASLWWHTGKQADALDLWANSADIPLIKQGARFLMEAERYEEAEKKWALLVNLNDKDSIHPYAVCLWKMKDLDRLDVLKKTHTDDAWLQWFASAVKPHEPQLEDALGLASVSLTQAAELNKAA